MSGNVETMAYAASGGTPWHKEGNPVADNLSWEEMLQAAGIAWTVIRVPTFVRVRKPTGLVNEKGEQIERTVSPLLVIENGSTREATAQESAEVTVRESQAILDAEYEYRTFPDQFALVRETDMSILGACGADYEPVQNWQVGKLLHDLLEKHGLHIETAGSLEKGRRVWFMAKIPKELNLAGDIHKSYLLAVNPHQAGKSIQFALTATRVVCSNTMAHALNNAKSTIRMVHRSDFETFAPQIKEVIGLAVDGFEKYGEVFEILGGTKIDRPEAIKLLAPILQPAKKTDKESYTPEQLVQRPEHMNRLMTDCLTQIEYAPGGTGRGGEWTTASVLNGMTYCTSNTWGRSAERRLIENTFGKYQSQVSDLRDSLLKYCDNQRAIDAAKAASEAQDAAKEGNAALVGELMPPPAVAAAETAKAAGKRGKAAH